MNTKSTTYSDDSDNENYSLLMIARTRIDMTVTGTKFFNVGEVVLEFTNHEAYAFLRQRQLRDMLDSEREGGGLEGTMMDFIKLMRALHPNKPIDFDVKVKFN